MNRDLIKESIRNQVSEVVNETFHPDEVMFTESEQAYIEETLNEYGDIDQLNETIKGRLVSGAGKFTTIINGIGMAIMSVTIPSSMAQLASAGIISAGAVGAYTTLNFVSLGIASVALIAIWVGSDRLGKVLDVKTYQKLEKKLQKNIKRRDAVITKAVDRGIDPDEKVLAKLTKQQQKIGMKMVKILDKNYQSVREVLPDNDFSRLNAIAVSAAEGKLTTLDELASKKVKK